MIEETTKEKIFVDGCSRWNLGKAGAGYVIKDVQGAVFQKGNKYLGDYLTNK